MGAWVRALWRNTAPKFDFSCSSAVARGVGSHTAASRVPMPETDWAKWGLTEEVVVVIVKPTPDAKLGVTLSSFDDDVPHPRVTGATSTPHRTALCCRTRKESPHPPCTLSTHWMAHLSYGLHSLWQR